MKILMITHLVPYPPRGGVTMRNFNLLKEMAKNHEITLLTFNQRAHFPDPHEYERSKEALRQYCKHLEVFDIPTDKSKLAWYLLLFFNLFSMTPYSVWRFSSRKMVRAIKAQINMRSFDLIEIGTIALVRFARLTPAVPKILVHHNVESELLYRRSKLAPDLLSRAYLRFQAWKLRRLEARVGGSFAYHTVCSEKDKEILHQICPDARIMVVPNGVDPDYFRPAGDPTAENSLIYVGGMGWFPNRDAMLYFLDRIWPLLKEHVPDIRMEIIGRDPPGKLVDYNLRDKNFRVLGFVDDIRPHVAKAAVYVVPIRVGGGTRLKILDAMAMGKAIVSTTIGCEGIEVDDGEEILIADDPEQFVSHVVALLKDDKERTRLGTNARKKAVEVYSWPRVARLLEKTYISSQFITNVLSTAEKRGASPGAEGDSGP